MCFECRDIHTVWNSTDCEDFGAGNSANDFCVKTRRLGLLF